MSGRRGFRVRRTAGKPRLLGEVHRSQANCAFVFHSPEHDLPPFRFPCIDAGHFMTNRVVEKQKTIPIQRERRDAFPPGGQVNDPEHAFVELNFPDAPFRRIVRAASAGHLRVLLWVHFCVGAVQRGSLRRWKLPRIRKRLSLEQGSPFFSRRFFRTGGCRFQRGLLGLLCLRARRSVGTNAQSQKNRDRNKEIFLKCLNWIPIHRKLPLSRSLVETVTQTMGSLRDLLGGMVLLDFMKSRTR